MSRSQLHRQLKALTGQTTTEFVRSQRLKRAAALLSKKGGNVSEVCYQVGFNNLSYFCQVLQRAVWSESFGVSDKMIFKWSRNQKQESANLETLHKDL